MVFSRASRSTRVLICTFVAATISFAGFLSADEILIDTETGLGQVGGFFDGIPAPDPMDPPTLFAPDNMDGFQNYFMGRTTIEGVTLAERRVFFMFDTAGLGALIPAGHEIVDVTINLDVVFGGVMANFTGDSEVVVFTSTDATPTEILAASLADPEEMLSIFDSFGTGEGYGEFEFKPGSDPEPTMPGEYAIPLPGAIPDLVDAIGMDEVFVISARLETFDPGPIGDDEFEFVFGLTDAVKTVEMPPGSGTFERVVDGGIVPYLNITTSAIPEPSGLLLILAMSAVAATLRSRKF